MATSVLHPRVDMWRFALVVAACGLGAFCAQAAGDDDLLATFGVSRAREFRDIEDIGGSDGTGGNGTDESDENGTDPEWTTLPPDDGNSTDFTTTSRMPGDYDGGLACNFGRDCREENAGCLALDREMLVPDGQTCPPGDKCICVDGESGGGGDEDTTTSSSSSQENNGGSSDEECNMQGDCEGDLKTCMDTGVPLFWGDLCSEGSMCWCTANSPKRDWPCRAGTGCGNGDACIDTSSSLACTDDTSNSSVTGCFCMAAPATTTTFSTTTTTTTPTTTRPALPTSTTMSSTTISAPATTTGMITTTPMLRTTVISIAQNDSTTVFVAATVLRESWTGGFNMDVAPADCEPMANDPKVAHGIADVMSNVSTVPRGYIEVSTKCDFVRRLSDKYLAGRQMQASGGVKKGVKVVYVIRVPTSLLGAKGFPSLASISSALGAVNVSMVSVLINAKLEEIGAGYAPVTVSGWQTPVNSCEDNSGLKTGSNLCGPEYAGDWDADSEKGASPAVVGGVVGAVAGCVVLMLITLVVVKTKVCQRCTKSQSNQGGLLHHQGQAAAGVAGGDQDGVSAQGV